MGKYMFPALLGAKRLTEAASNRRQRNKEALMGTYNLLQQKLKEGNQLEIEEARRALLEAQRGLYEARAETELAKGGGVQLPKGLKETDLQKMMTDSVGNFYKTNAQGFDPNNPEHLKWVKQDLRALRGKEIAEYLVPEEPEPYAGVEAPVSKYEFGRKEKAEKAIFTQKEKEEKRAEEDKKDTIELLRSQGDKIAQQLAKTSFTNEAMINLWIKQAEIINDELSALTGREENVLFAAMPSMEIPKTTMDAIDFWKTWRNSTYNSIMMSTPTLLSPEEINKMIANQWQQIPDPIRLTIEEMLGGTPYEKAFKDMKEAGAGALASGAEGFVRQTGETVPEFKKPPMEKPLPAPGFDIPEDVKANMREVKKSGRTFDWYVQGVKKNGHEFTVEERNLFEKYWNNL